MGLLVGNTTVIEHAGTYVQYSRIYSHVKFAPEKVEIGFVLPKGIPLSDGQLLAKGIVHAQLGLKVHQAKKVDALCQMVFDEPLLNFMRKDNPEKVYKLPKEEYDMYCSVAAEEQTWD